MQIALSARSDAAAGDPMRAIDELIRAYGMACHESKSATAMNEAHRNLRLAIAGPVADSAMANDAPAKTQSTQS